MEALLLSFANAFFGATSWVLSAIIFEKMQTVISKTWQLTPKQSIWINNTKGFFFYFRENCPFNHLWMNECCMNHTCIQCVHRQSFHTSTCWAHLQSSDSTLLMMSARSKGSGMLGSSTPQKGRSTGASSGGNVWARLEWHLRRQDTGNKHSYLLLPPIKT